MKYNKSIVLNELFLQNKYLEYKISAVFTKQILRILVIVAINQGRTSS